MRTPDLLNPSFYIIDRKLRNRYRELPKATQLMSGESTYNRDCDDRGSWGHRVLQVPSLKEFKFKPGQKDSSYIKGDTNF